MNQKTLKTIYVVFVCFCAFVIFSCGYALAEIKYKQTNISCTSNEKQLVCNLKDHE